jgi:NAD(P)-dependent dehydrogenase (short-subunit alcohol dehydrogenase family)
MRIDASGALVAGGASGLGEATVRELHARGAMLNGEVIRLVGALRMPPR